MSDIVNNEAAVEATEKAIEVLENLDQKIENVVTITKNNPFVMFGLFAVGLTIGGVVGYKIGVQRTSLKYEEILETEIAEAKQFYKRLAKDGEFKSPESAVQALVPDDVVNAVRSYQGREKTSYNKPEEIEEGEVETKFYNSTTHELEERKVLVEEHNVFVDSAADPQDWDYDVEKTIRLEKPDQPYVISFEEFQENPEGHEQATLSYFSGDDTLADDKDGPIDNTEYTVGDDNLLRFGAGSQDPNVVYIRNERLSMDFEVVKSQGSYSKEVLGLDTPDDTTLRHSSRHPNRSRRNAPLKFRGNDE